MTVNKLTFPSKENAVQEKINEIIDNLVTDNVYWATYGTTTFTDIMTAINAGKLVLCRDTDISDNDYVYIYRSHTSTTITFYNVSSNSNTIVMVDSSNNWDLTDVSFLPDQTYDGTSTNAQSGVAIAGELNKYVKLDGGSSVQTISLSSGTGTTALGVKSRSTTSSYISFTSSSTWLGSIGVNSSKKPVFYNGTGYTLAYTSDIPTVNNATITFTQGGVTKGTITLNQASNDTIALDAGGGGGASALTDLSDVSITSASSGEALTYDGNDWINAPKTLVTIKDWTVS